MWVNSFCFDAAPGKAFSLSRSKARQIESKSCSFHISYLILAHLLILKWRLQKIYVMLIHLDTFFSHWTIEVPICHWDFSYQMHLVDLSYYRVPPPHLFIYLGHLISSMLTICQLYFCYQMHLFYFSFYRAPPPPHLFIYLGHLISSMLTGDPVQSSRFRSPAWTSLHPARTFFRGLHTVSKKSTKIENSMNISWWGKVKVIHCWHFNDI